VAQGVGPEFKPQYQRGKEKKKKKKKNWGREEKDAYLLNSLCHKCALLILSGSLQ
jgi:hypothetical protein